MSHATHVVVPYRSFISLKSCVVLALAASLREHMLSQLASRSDESCSPRIIVLNCTTREWERDGLGITRSSIQYRLCRARFAYYARFLFPTRIHNFGNYPARSRSGVSARALPAASPSLDARAGGGAAGGGAAGAGAGAAGARPRIE